MEGRPLEAMMSKGCVKVRNQAVVLVTTGYKIDFLTANDDTLRNSRTGGR